MKKLWKYFDGYKKELFLGPTLKLTEAVFELFIPLIMATIIDVGIANRDMNYVLKMGGLLVLLGALGFGCAAVCQYYAAKVGYGFGRALRQDMFKKIMTLSGSQIDEIGTDSLITRITNDANQVQTGVNMFIRLAIRAPFLTVGAVIMAFVINTEIAIIFLISMIIISIILAIVMVKSVPYYTNLQKKQDEIGRITSENMEGVRVIRAFDRTQREIERFKNTGEDFAKLTIRVGKLSALLNPLTYIVANVAIIAIVWYGSQFANLGILASGDIVALVSYMTQTLIVLVVFANLVVIFTKASASIKRVNEILDMEIKIKDPECTKTNRENNTSIEFKNVNFTYKKGTPPALENASFTINKGETIGIIGGTGCGKTTIVNLICRFYDSDSGEILIDGINIKDYKQTELREKIGLVPQKAVLFSGTVRDNMKFANSEATDEEIWRALEISQSAEFIKSKGGLDYAISVEGKNVSGGQRQRLTIARAVVSKHSVLILDDSSSALDYETDRALRSALEKNKGNSSVIMVSQRALGVKSADKILVVDDGQIIGIGTHNELIKNCEVYKEICLSQGILQED